MNLAIISSDNAPKAIGPYSQAVRAGSLLFCSGQIALDPVTGAVISEDVREQTVQVMKNIEAVLHTAGTELSSVIKTTVFLVDINDFGVVNDVYGSFFGDHKPARSTVAVQSLPRGVRVEIEVIASAGDIC